MTKQQPITIAVEAKSRLDIANDVRSLTIQSRTLEEKVDFWNGWMMGGLVVAAIAAIVVLLSTRFVLIRSKQLGATQSALSGAKDRGLLLDLSQKDLEIAQLNNSSSEAAKSIGVVKREAAKANEHASLLQIEAAKLGPRVLLFKDKITEFRKVANSHPRQKAEFRFDTMRSNGLGLASDSDAFDLARNMTYEFSQWGWAVPAEVPDTNWKSCGVFVLVSPRASHDTQRAAMDLARVMHEATLSPSPIALKNENVPLPRIPTIVEGKEVSFAPFDDDTIVVQICPHP